MVKWFLRPMPMLHMPRDDGHHIQRRWFHLKVPPTTACTGRGLLARAGDAHVGWRLGQYRVECPHMTTANVSEPWAAGQPYEHFMGRWSRRIARAFIHWLAPPQPTSGPALERRPT